MKNEDHVDHELHVVWDVEVAALAGPHLTQMEQKLGRIMSPTERLIWLDGLNTGLEKWLHHIETELEGISTENNDDY